MNPYLLLAAIVSLVGALLYGEHDGRQTGAEQERLIWTTKMNARLAEANAKILALENAARDKEHAMQTANEKVIQDYESLKTATATAVSALDADRVRLQQALSRARSGNSAAPANPQAGLPPDAAPESRILSECLARYEAVAGDADELSNGLKALQDYVNNVVPK